MTESPPPPDHELDRVFQALSDSSRRRILQLLREADELRVSDVASAFNMSLNGVSKHLKTLEKAGLITREVRGREHWLLPNSAPLLEARRFFSLIENFWHERLQAFEETLLKNTTQTSEKESKEQ